MSITDQITRLQNAKASIKASIENKGVSVSDDTKLDGYSALIDNIQTGGSGETHVNPEFYEARTQNSTIGDYLFAGTNIKNDDTSFKEMIESLDTSKITSMQHMFDSSCYYMSNSTKDLDLSKWDVSKCKNFYYIFNSFGMENLNISGWNFASISSLSNFLGATYVKNLNMSNCDISHVTKLEDFAKTYGGAGLVTINLTGCDTSHITNMNGMFSNYNILTDIIGPLDLSNLTNGFCYSTYSRPIYNCKKLETLYLKNIYKNCTMTNASKWSIDLSDTVVKDECLVYIINELPDLVNDKGLTATDKIILTLPKTNTLTAEQVKVATDKGWTVANTTY